MKNRLPLSILLVTLLFQSCSPTVPKIVNRAFTKKFLGAENAVWDEGPDKDWKVTFYMKKFHYMTAFYTSNGKFESIEIEIYSDDIPKNLVDTVFSRYPNATVFKVFEKIREQSTDYIFEIEDKGQLFGICFRNGGNMKIIPPNDQRFVTRIQMENN